MTVQWVTAVIAAFVGFVGYMQWRVAQNKAALDLFEKRREVYEGVRKAVAQIVTQSQGFGPQQESDFLDAMHRAYFFFGDDVQRYLQALWEAILDVQSADQTFPGLMDPADKKKCLDKRRDAFNRVEQFYKVGQPLFARYMRFSEKVPGSLLSRLWSR